MHGQQNIKKWVLSVRNVQVKLQIINGLKRR